MRTGYHRIDEPFLSGFLRVNASVEQAPARRRFTVADGLILIGAIALALGQLRATQWFARFPLRVRFWAETLNSGIPGFTSWDFTLIWIWMRRGNGHQIITQVATESYPVLFCVLVAMTLVQPILRLRSPRPPLRELIHQSGFVACVAVIVGTFLFVDLWWFAVIPNSSLLVEAAMLLLLWPILGLRPWSLEPSWIDRLGRGVGWGWIILRTGVTVFSFL